MRAVLERMPARGQQDLLRALVAFGQAALVVESANAKARSA
ncbi:hypothetical protein GCM10029963_09120 [Micromonospora andamanensis]